MATPQAEIAAWSAGVNDNQRAVDWQFTIDKTRFRRKRLYPKRSPGQCTGAMRGSHVDE